MYESPEVERNWERWSIPITTSFENTVLIAEYEPDTMLIRSIIKFIFILSLPLPSDLVSTPCQSTSLL